MGRYAANTDVPSDRSRAEIEKILQRYGAQKFLYGWENNSAAIMFEAHGRRIRFVLPLPDRNGPEFTKTPGRGRERNPAAAQQAYEQAVRQKWRALALAIKAKLEAVESQIATFEGEFLNYVVLPNNQTVGQWLGPQLETSYATHRMPPMMLEGPPTRGKGREADVS
jgi:hypothetical protein